MTIDVGVIGRSHARTHRRLANVGPNQRPSRERRSAQRRGGGSGRGGMTTHARIAWRKRKRLRGYQSEVIHEFYRTRPTITRWRIHPSQVIYLADSADVPRDRRGGFHDEDDDNGDDLRAGRDGDDDASDDVVPTRYRSPSSPFVASSSVG